MSNRQKTYFIFSSRKFWCFFIGAFFLFSAFAAGLGERDVMASPETAGSPSAATTLSRNLSAQSNTQSPDNIWQFVEEDSIASAGERQIVPQIYRTARVNENGLKEILGKAPLEFTQESKASNLTLALPMPDGSFSTFRIEESPIMEPELAEQYPEIKTYRGQGIDDPAATTRFDLTPAGFHAMILSERGAVYIAPFAKGDTANYITYFKTDYRNDANVFNCEFSKEDNAAPASQSAGPNVANGTVLRTYRLALAATGEYTAFTGGTVATALAAMTTTMNRVNGIYEREVSVRMVLVANDNLIIYTNAATDPYTNNNGQTMLGQNQANLDSVIGTANYDIGHVFSTGGGGIAGLSVVCSASNKARGVTGLPAPVGDGFDVDFVAHEMGHQFGGLHTFNGTAGNCNGNRSGSAAYETGSGSTIMAYAGICSSQNLQANSNDYFHVKSLEQIEAFIAGTSCDVETSTGNAVPAVTAGSSLTIPRSTPFTLTAEATDSNGDALSYCWEEYDLGLASPPDNDADGSARPIFRSFNPTLNPARTFPKLSDVVNNTSTFGESLPTINRTMNFKVTVRDNRVGGGGINTATTQVIVSAGAGPFLVTQPNTNVSWTGGTQQAVTWNVANTAGAPVGAASVKISLSTDGGSTFPIVLADNTQNDGAESLTVPDTPTTSARVKVEAVGNIFFDMSNANFTIVQGAGGAGVDTAALYNPSGGAFFLRNSNSGGIANITFTYGPVGLGFLPISGDWDGDGMDTIGLYDPARAAFFLRNSNSGGIADITFTYGPAGLGFVPIVGDWDGDGDDTIGLYNPSGAAFFLRNSNSGGIADITFTYGPAGMGFRPLVGDWNGDGVDTVGLYSPANAGFFLRNSNSGGIADITFTYGPPGLGFIAIVGDWNGDGTDTIGLYAPANAAFFLRNANSGGIADITFTYGPAGLGFVPLVGDWDGL